MPFDPWSEEQLRTLRCSVLTRSERRLREALRELPLSTDAQHFLRCRWRAVRQELGRRGLLREEDAPAQVSSGVPLEDWSSN